MSSHETSEKIENLVKGIEDIKKKQKEIIDLKNIVTKGGWGRTPQWIGSIAE